MTRRGILTGITHSMFVASVAAAQTSTKTPPEGSCSLKVITLNLVDGSELVCVSQNVAFAQESDTEGVRNVVFTNGFIQQVTNSLADIRVALMR